jgi:predicted aldo/keto reductase-like oxidoreductase
MDGKNEEIVARALKGRRDKVFVATKTLPTSQNKEDIIRDVEKSLMALETDHIDVIQLHNLTGKERIFNPETREALARLKQQGKVRFCGVTTHKNEAEVLNALVDDPDRFFDTCLVKYNFTAEKEVETAIARAAKAGIGIIAMKTQAGGYAAEALGRVSPHQAALKWALQNPNVTMAIPGMKDLTQLREDVAVMGMEFRHADSRILQRYSAAVQPYYCHICGRCEATCPSGVEISTINRALMYAEGYGSPDLARATYRELPRAVSAAVCLDCAACTAKCVNGLDIAAMMATARVLLG